MVFEDIKKIIAEQLQLDQEKIDEINEETSLLKDLEADSLDAVEIIMSIETQFDIEIPDEDAEDFHVLGDIVEYVEKKIKEKS